MHAGETEFAGMSFLEHSRGKDVLEPFGEDPLSESLA